MEVRPNRGTGNGSHALVIGGSIAGLLASRILSTHFDRVTVVERDNFSREPVPRKGIPQASHTHIMLRRGTDILEHLFPGIRGHLVAAGAPLVDMANDVAWLTPFGWGVSFPSELVMLACSRNLLEWSVRRRVSAHPNGTGSSPITFTSASELRMLKVSPPA